MNASVRNYLLSAFSWSPDKLVKLQRWLQTSWISGCTKSLSQSLWWIWKIAGYFQRAPWRPPTWTRQSGVEARNWRLFQGRMMLFIPHFPLSICPRGLFYLDASLSHRGLFLQDISHNTTLLYPLASSNTNLGVNFNAGRLLACTSSKVAKIQIISCFSE